MTYLSCAIKVDWVRLEPMTPAWQQQPFLRQQSTTSSLNSSYGKWTYGSILKLDEELPAKAILSFGKAEDDLYTIRDSQIWHNFNKNKSNYKFLPSFYCVFGSEYIRITHYCEKKECNLKKQCCCLLCFFYVGFLASLLRNTTTSYPNISQLKEWTDNSSRTGSAIVNTCFPVGSPVIVTGPPLQ